MSEADTQKWLEGIIKGDARTPKNIQDLIVVITKKYADEGKIIEAGFATMLATGAINGNLQPEVIAQLRMVFFAGAQHLWGSIMSMSDDGANVTDAESRRMDLINEELIAFAKDIAMHLLKTEGGAQ